GLRTIIITGRPELEAPDWRGNLPGKPMSNQEVTDVVAWLTSHRVSNPGQPYSVSNYVQDRESKDVRRKYNFSARPIHEGGNSLQWTGDGCPCRPDRTISLFVGDARAGRRLPFLGASRPRQRIPRRGYAPRYISKSLRDTDRREDRRNSVLGAAS